MSFFLTNEKGLFARPLFKGIITVDGLAYLQTKRSSMDGKDAAVFDEFATLVRQLPVGDGFFFYGKNDTKIPNPNQSERHPYGHGHTAAYGWINPGNFQGSSSGANPLESNDPKDCGWATVEALVKPGRRKAWADLMDRYGLTVGYNALIGASMVAQRAQTWQFASNDSLQKLSEVQACVAFSPKNNGYLNDKGSFSPLSGARLFESPEAARRTSKSRWIDNAVLVMVTTKVTGLVPGQPLPDNLGELAGVLAKLEAERLSGVLEPAATDAGSAARVRRPRM